MYNRTRADRIERDAPSAVTQARSMRYEPPSINFHLEQPPPRELWEREQIEPAAGLGIKQFHRTANDALNTPAIRQLRRAISSLRRRGGACAGPARRLEPAERPARHEDDRQDEEDAVEASGG